MRATLARSSPPDARPANSSITLGGSPAASTVTGASISSGAITMTLQTVERRRTNLGPPAIGRAARPADHSGHATEPSDQAAGAGAGRGAPRRAPALPARAHGRAGAGDPARPVGGFADGRDRRRGGRPTPSAPSRGLGRASRSPAARSS